MERKCTLDLNRDFLNLFEPGISRFCVRSTDFTVLNPWRILRYPGTVTVLLVRRAGM